MHSRRPFQALSATLILSFLLMLAGPARAARGEPVRSPMMPQPQMSSLVKGGSLYWNTFLGGNGFDGATDTATDTQGNLYIAGGSTSSWGNPLNPHAGDQDAFVAKLDSSGTLVWSTFLGSASSDYAWTIALDASGNVYVGGGSDATWGSPVRAFSAGHDALVAKLNDNGALLWNTFLGGSTADYAWGIAVDRSGNVRVTGSSDASWGSPVDPFTTPPGYPPTPTDVFVAALDTNGSLVWNTFVGSSEQNYDSDIALDGSGNSYVTANTPGIFYTSFATFVAKLDSNGALAWKTLPAPSSTSGGIAVDGAGNIYITGSSGATWGSPVRPFSGSIDAFVAKLDGSGALIWNTFLGGSNQDYAWRIALDADANSFVAGTSLATWGTPMHPFAGNMDVFVARVDSAGATLRWNTFLGAMGNNAGAGIALDGKGNIYTVGVSASTWGNPIFPFAGGAEDAFVAKLNGTTVLYVKQSATGTNDGTSWTNAYTGLQSALAVATSGDQIWVAAGTYLPTASTDRTVSFALKDGVAIYGGFIGAPGTEGDFSQRDPAVNPTILSGDIGAQADASDNSYHVVLGSNVTSSAMLDGFTITAGNANAWPADTGGGGMQIDGISHITLSAVTFSNNTASFDGGGLTDHGSTGSSLELTNVAFTANTALAGGGMIGGASNPALTDVTFEGNTAQTGGGMANSGGSPTLTNAAFNNNTATGDPSYGGGGGMYNEGSSPVLTNVHFNANTASTGGGMSNATDRFRNRTSNPTLTNVTFTGNKATSSNSLYGGGGMHNDFGSSPALTNATFTANSAITGGGIHNDRGSSPMLTDVTFSNNTASLDGGGMSNHSSSNPQLTDVTFSGNVATVIGGGMSNDNSNPVLTNVTFNGNTAVAAGGGIYNQSSSPALHNTILWSDSAPAGSEMYNESVGVPAINHSVLQGGCPAGSTCMNLIVTDPQLGTLGDYGGFTQTIPIGAGSSAIDTGDPAHCPATDQRGVTRPQDGDWNGSAICDIGAYELENVPPYDSLTTLTSDYPDPSTVGESVTIEFSVGNNRGGGPTPVGTVAVNDGATIICNDIALASGNGSCSYAFATPGSHSLTAIFTPTDTTQFSGSTSAAETHTVSAYETTTSITSDSPDPSDIGQDVTIDFSVTNKISGGPTPGGTVDVSDGATIICNGALLGGSGNGTCTYAFTASGSHNLTAVFTPTDSAQFDGSASAAEPHTVNAAPLVPAFSVTPASWNYDVVQVNASASKLFTVRNTGVGDLVMSGPVTLTGANPGQFQILPGSTCSNATLHQYQTCTVTVAFKPTAAGARSVGLRFPDNAAGHPHTVALSGRGGIEQALNGGFNIYAGTSKIPSNWTAAQFSLSDGRDTINKKEGLAALKIAGQPGKAKTLTQTRAIGGAAGNAFVLSLWRKSTSIPGTAGLVRAQVLFYSGSSLVQTATLALPNGAYNWTQQKLAFTAAHAYTKVVIKLTYSKGSGTVWFDGLSLLKSP